MSRLDCVVTFDCFQVSKTANRQALLIALSLVNHPKDMLCENFPRLLADGLVTLLKLPINSKSPFNSGGGDSLFN